MSWGDKFFQISLNQWNHFFRVRKSTLLQFILVPKDKLCIGLVFSGFLLAMLGSLNPWFLWSINTKFPLLASMLILPAIFIARSRCKDDIFTRKDLFIAFLIFFIYEFYLQSVNDKNINAYIVGVFNYPIVYALFKLDRRFYAPFMTVACKCMALMMCVSIPCFVLHLVGFSFPGHRAVFGDYFYIFTNYYFFMVDDRFVWDLIPRFSSVFLEPGHLGTATVMLLLTQMGKWKKWYNLVLWVTTLMTFSLAAYVYAVVLLVLNSWVHRRKIFVKLIMVVVVVVSAGVGSFYYNNGDNMLHNLIVLRLEVDDAGKIAGDNRVTESFKREFDSFMTSSDIWFGREMPKSEFGNSGYRVFIYENGMCALFLVVMLYLFVYRGTQDKRAVFSAMSIVILAFVVRGYPLWYSNFIPCVLAGYNVFKGD